MHEAVPEFLARFRQLSPVSIPTIHCDTSLIILVNPQGCAARFHHPLKVGTAVRLSGLPTNISVTAKVVNCISIGSEKLWLLGFALDEPGDVWGIQSPPEDWALF